MEIIKAAPAQTGAALLIADERGLTLIKNVRKLRLPMNYRTKKRPAKNTKLHDEQVPYQTRIF